MNILKLTVKKDVFDKLASGEQSYVYVDANGYWIRRLALNSADSFKKLKETQAFRTFDFVDVTCAKENAQYQFKSIRTGYEDMTTDGIDTGICIWITGNKDEANEPEAEAENETETEVSFVSEDNEPINEPDTTETLKDAVNDIEEKVDFNEETGELTVTGKAQEVFNREYVFEDNTETDEEGELTTDLTEIEEKKQAFMSNINFIIDVIGGFDNVVVVNRPNIIITSNGRIFGTKDRIDINNDVEIRVSIGTEKIYDETNDDIKFLQNIESYLCDYAKSGYVFIWKDDCDLVYTETGRYIKLRMTKKLYMR